MPPVYDDIAYFTDALSRMIQFRTGGISAVLDRYVHSAMQSPFSTFGAIVGFSLTDDNQTSPYVFNAVAIFALTMFWLRLFRASLPISLVVGAILVTTPWFDNAVTIYHPDLIAGYGVAIIASALICQQTVLTSTRRVVVTGLATGLVLSIKPTAFPATLVILGAALVFGALQSRLSRETWAAVVRRTTVGLGCACLTAAPYYLVNTKYIIAYIIQTLAIEGDVWRKVYTDTFGEVGKYTFYLDQTVEQISPLWVAVGALALAVAAFVAWRSRREAPLTFLALLVCIALAYVIATMTAVRLMLFGLQIYGLALVTTFLAILVAFEGTWDARLWSSRVWQTPLWLIRPWPALRFDVLRATIAIALLCLAGASVRDAQGHFPQYYVEQLSTEYDKVYRVLQAVDDRLKQSDPTRTLTALFPAPGPVPPPDYAFRAMQDDRRFTIEVSTLETKMEPVLSQVKAADILFIQDEKLLGFVGKYPINLVLPELLEKVRSDPGFVEQPAVDVPFGKIFVFERRR